MQAGNGCEAILLTDPNNCGACGHSCGPNAACSGGSCFSLGPTCTDGIKNGNETAVDCGGGTCPACPVGLSCQTNGDCVSNACNTLTLTCASNQCADNHKDGAETDVDCGGGTCAACATGKKCAINSDCASNACDAISLTCVANQCMDHRQDGQETDVDCGGTFCGACAVGQKCLVNNDCGSAHTCNPVTKICQ